MKTTTYKCDVCKKKVDQKELIIMTVAMNSPRTFVKCGAVYNKPQKQFDICLKCGEARGFICKLEGDEASKFQESPADVIYGAIEELVYEAIENQ